MWLWRYKAVVAGLCAAVLTGTVLTAPAATATTGEAKVVPIQVTGDPAKRFNLVIMGDGYTDADMPTFREHVNEHVNVLWTLEPFKSYRSYLNVYAIEIPSAESGVSCDPGLADPRRNTPLNMGFWGGCNPDSVQRLLSVDSAAAERYAGLVGGTAPGNRQILALGNSETYGGAGGRYATASGGNALSALITPHELGHSLGGLQDEYDYYQRGERGGSYTGDEPGSVHHTLLTEDQMREQRRKWWRWLGEPSESGGVIGRYEGGLYSSKGVWRPSKHSFMKSLGYYFDQVSRETLTQRISAKTSILQDSTPNTVPIGADRVVWVETLHPVSHELDVTWTLDGTELDTANARAVDLRALELDPGTHTLTATVTDPTEFVRDPAIRLSPALTRNRTWLLDTGVRTPPEDVPAGFTGSTPTDTPVSGDAVVYADPTHPPNRVPAVEWAVDGEPVANPGNDADLDLGALDLQPGAHTLTATVADDSGSDTLTWRVDANAPAADYRLSAALLTVPKPGRPTEYIFNGPFTMSLTARDDTDGYLVREFRTDGDGWFNYFGWPTDPDAPFLFTAEGTTIDDLVYGKLGEPRLVPWDDVPPGYGRHTIEYRATDPAGNRGEAEEFVVTLLPEPPACTTTVTGRHAGPLVVRGGVTCLDGARVAGPVTVRPGASLVARDATITGPVHASGAATVQVLTSTVRGPVRVGGGEDVTVVGSTLHGPVALTGNEAAVLAGSTVTGPLHCAGNTAAPDTLQAPNTVRGPATGQCAGLG